MKNPLWLALLLCVPGAIGQQTFYVSTTGNDANPGTQSAPWESNLS